MAGPVRPGAVCKTSDPPPIRPDQWLTSRPGRMESASASWMPPRPVLETTPGTIAMPKINTHRGAAKRFRKTASGKYKAGHANRSHILTKKAIKRKRNLRQTNHVRAEDAGRLDRMLPYL